jgi:hypothetical protein
MFLCTWATMLQVQEGELFRPQRHRRRLLLLRWWRCGSGRLWAGLLIPRVWGGQPLGNRLAPAMVGAAGPLFAFKFFGHPDPRKYVFLCIWLYIHILPSPTLRVVFTGFWWVLQDKNHTLLTFDRSSSSLMHHPFKYGVVLVCLAWIMEVEANYVRYSDLRGKPYSVTYDKRSIIVDGI